MNPTRPTEPRGLALIVDDHDQNRKFLARVLQSEGFECLQAQNGQEALDLFAQHAFDMVFMDVLMPGMNGYETTHKIRSSLQGRFIPIIFLTALSDDESLIECIKSGGDDFITKPFNISILKARILSLERIRNLYRDLERQHRALSQRYANEQLEKILAERIFRDELTSKNITIPGVEILQRSADVFCGDIVLIAPLPEGGVRFLVADFTGHGLAAAIGAIPVTEIFHSLSAQGASDLELLTIMNTKLHRLLPIERFMAACLVSLYPENRTLCLWNGGMPPVLLRRGQEMIEYPTQALPLGIDLEPPPPDSLTVLHLQADERLLIMSDGVLEAVDAAGVEFQNNELRNLKHRLVHQDTLLPLLVATLNAHCADAEQADDITATEIPVGAIMADHLTQFANTEGSSPVTQPQASVATATSSSVQQSRWSLELCDQRLADVSLPKQAMDFLSGFQDIPPEHITGLDMIISELYLNAFEHGVLQLDSRIKSGQTGFEEYYAEKDRRIQQGIQGCISLTLDFSIQPPFTKTVTINLRDSGSGFAGAKNRVHQQPEPSQPWGRGIFLVQSMSATVRYNDQGNAVEVVYRW